MIDLLRRLSEYSLVRRCNQLRDVKKITPLCPYVPKGESQAVDQERSTGHLWPNRCQTYTEELDSPKKRLITFIIPSAKVFLLTCNLIQLRKLSVLSCHWIYSRCLSHSNEGSNHEVSPESNPSRLTSFLALLQTCRCSQLCYTPQLPTFSVKVLLKFITGRNFNRSVDQKAVSAK